MAGFSTKTFTKHDDYMTPKSAWINIRNYIPKDKVIWEAFYGNNQSGTFLKELGYNVIHKDIDFFEHNLGEIVVSNPPFTKIKDIMFRLINLNKPFIMIMPVSKMSTQYFRKIMETTQEKIQIIIPRKRINFDKMVDGKIIPSPGANFDCYYYCFRMNFANDINFLGDDECIEMTKEYKEAKKQAKKNQEIRADKK